MNRIVVITGASRNLGLAIATEFAKRDWQVIGTGRSKRPAELPEKVVYHQFDASDADQGLDFWNKLHQENPDTEICLINNAGSYESGTLLETSPEDYAKEMNSVYFSAVYMTQGLAKTYSQARIINVISTSALSADPQHTAYGSAKAAEQYFFQVLQKEFKAEQYQITNLYPSYIGPTDSGAKSIRYEDMAGFIREQAELDKTYYIRDVTLYPR